MGLGIVARIGRKQGMREKWWRLRSGRLTGFPNAGRKPPAFVVEKNAERARP
jgi:hypothetical protein